MPKAGSRSSAATTRTGGRLKTRLQALIAYEPRSYSAPPPAAEVVAHVRRIEELLGHRGVHRTHLADGAGSDDLVELGPLRVIAKGEAFLDVPAGAVALGAEPFDLFGADAQRLLAQHVLAGFKARSAHSKCS